VLGNVTARAAAQHGPGKHRLRENEDEAKLAVLVVERKGAWSDRGAGRRGRWLWLRGWLGGAGTAAAETRAGASMRPWQACSLALGRERWSTRTNKTTLACIRKQEEEAARQGATTTARGRSCKEQQRPLVSLVTWVERNRINRRQEKGTPACTAACAASYSHRQKWLASRNRNAAAAGAAVRGHRCGAGVRALCTCVMGGA
jgi:hypothetical protein